MEMSAHSIVNVSKQQKLSRGVLVIPANVNCKETMEQTSNASFPEKNYHQPKLALNVAELAEVLGIGINSAYELVHSQGFPAIYVGRRIVIPIKALEDWLNLQVQSA